MAGTKNQDFGRASLHADDADFRDARRFFICVQSKDLRRSKKSVSSACQNARIIIN